ncbi:hypothetical protein [Deinococcus sp. NW-56]|uniref:hypothetical protein n=1 Tax=Deinococcus sp. NW-56 TaxID=2080419 RepID=UPI000CF40CF4|nr:hypothetical protein [Deinococcus sp. NW-56]
MIVADLYARLRAALPETVPVLRPEQVQVPAEWQEEDAQGELVEGGARGQLAYLQQQAPQGYVQVETPVPIRTDGLVASYAVAVATIAPDAALAQDLGLRVRRILCGHSYAPEAYRESRPAVAQPLQPGAWLYRPTYERVTLDGLLAGG